MNFYTALILAAIFLINLKSRPKILPVALKTSRFVFLRAGAGLARSGLCLKLRHGTQ
jgi:hypothetical protein